MLKFLPSEKLLSGKTLPVSSYSFFCLFKSLYFFKSSSILHPCNHNNKIIKWIILKAYDSSQIINIYLWAFLIFFDCGG